MSRKSSVAETIRASRKAPKPGDTIPVKLDNAAPASGTVRRVTPKSIVVKLDVPVLSLAGTLLYAQGSEVHLPRNPPTLNEAPTVAYVNQDGAQAHSPTATVAPSRPEPNTALREAFLTTILAQRSRLAALQAETKALESELRLQEAQALSALKAGAPIPPGWRAAINVETSSTVRPAWKDEALTLAQQQGLDPALYEESVRARTQPSVTRKEILIVERA